MVWIIMPLYQGSFVQVPCLCPNDILLLYQIYIFSKKKIHYYLSFGELCMAAMKKRNLEYVKKKNQEMVVF